MLGLKNVTDGCFSLGVATLSAMTPCPPEAAVVTHAGRSWAKPQGATVALVQEVTLLRPRWIRREKRKNRSAVNGRPTTNSGPRCQPLSFEF